MARKVIIVDTPLEKAVLRSMKRHTEPGRPMETFIRDLMYGGCASGVVGEMIYYTDTLKFFKKHREEIGKLLNRMVQETGLPPEKLFGDKWDAEDPLALDTNNQNLLAWFAYEETARDLAQRMGIEV